MRKLIVYWNAHGTLRLIKRIFFNRNNNASVTIEILPINLIDSPSSHNIQNLKFQTYPRPKLPKNRINLLLDLVANEQLVGVNGVIARLAILLANQLDADLRVVCFGISHIQHIDIDRIFQTEESKSSSEISFVCARESVGYQLDIASNDYFLTGSQLIKDEVCGCIKSKNLIHVKVTGDNYQPNFKALLAIMLEGAS